MSIKKKIFFRADAGINVGYGHFIRTLALADMLKEEFDCTFFTQAPTKYQVSEMNSVCNYISLPCDETKFNLFLEYLKGDEIVVLDNYFFSTEYQTIIKNKGCKLVCIDDIHDKHYVADIVINHGLNDKNLFSVEPYTKLCLGLEWALLRKPFLDVKLNKSKIYSTEDMQVVICFGGVDWGNLTNKMVNYLLNLEVVSKIIAIVGDGNSQAYIKNDKVEYKSNLSASQISEVFLQSDLAILSASTVCIEAFACGIPVAAGWWVDNQEQIYKYYQESNFINPLGYLLDTKTFQISNKIRKVLDTSKIKNDYIKIFHTI